MWNLEHKQAKKKKKIKRDQCKGFYNSSGINEDAFICSGTFGVGKKMLSRGCFWKVELTGLAGELNVRHDIREVLGLLWDYPKQVEAWSSYHWVKEIQD